MDPKIVSQQVIVIMLVHLLSNVTIIATNHHAHMNGNANGSATQQKKMTKYPWWSYHINIRLKWVGYT